MSDPFDARSPFEKLWEFHETYNVLRERVPTLPDASTEAGAAMRTLRKEILAEEYQEYLDGEKNNDLVEIADALYLGEATVKTHVRHILDKLNAPDRTRAAILAMERGLLRH